LDIINKLRDTMTSHERVSVVEVMGRHCGDIALYSGIASGAEIIVVPEIAFDLNEITEKINRSRANGKHSNIIVVAEGVMSADEFAKSLQAVTEYSVRPTCIGHVQRGGSPTMADRMLAAQFGNKAVRLLNDGIGNRVAAIVYGPESVIVVAGVNKIVDTLEDAVRRARTVAAPMNKQRFDTKTPCEVTGACGDCKSEDCICNQILTTRNCKPAGRIKFIIVGEELGL
jgi:6-phosphofructokinase 1